MKTLDAALEYLRLGFHPIPCKPHDKRPAVEWKKYQEQLPTEAEVKGWFNLWPSANVAIILGGGAFALDLDGAEAAEKLLTDRGIILPNDAPRVRTANGLHVYLRADCPISDRVGLVSVNGKKPQIDVRGVGYCLAPPSIHPTGARYAWIIPLRNRDDLPRAPQNLVDLILKEPENDRRRENDNGISWVAEALRGVPEGQRDATCTRLAGYFIQKHIDPETVKEILAESFARNCEPPFPQEMVIKCVDSVARKHAMRGETIRTIKPELLATVLDRFMKSLDGPPEQRAATHSMALNAYLGGGFAPGELCYIGARPGVGKTAFALQVAKTVAQDGRSVLVVSREMTNEALARRIVAQTANVSAGKLRAQKLNEFEVKRVLEHVHKLKDLPVYMTDEVISSDEIVEMVTDFRGSLPLGLLIVDYLQLVRAPREIKDRRLQIESISQGLKTLALQFKIPVVCLSSLSRPADKKASTRPTLASLRESGELEHDADTVVLMHREPMAEDVEVIVAKNRDGRQGVARLKFEAEYLRFTEPSDRQSESVHSDDDVPF
jgi:archaellum biogenesis ATPase FlaH